MKLKRNQITHIQSAFVIFLALVLLSYLGLLLQKELSPRSVRGGASVKVARLEETLNTVQRKFDKEVLWEVIQNSEDLYKRDAIRTAENSEARITFTDGSVIELSENSLVVLDRSEDQIELEFLQGNVFAKGGGKQGKVAIKTAQGRIKLDQGSEGQLSLSKEKSSLEVTVEKGSVDLETENGKTSINEHEKGSLSTDGVKKEKLLIWPETPVANARFISNKKIVSIPFEWNHESYKGNVFVQISKNEKFSIIYKEIQVRNHQLKKIKYALPQGEFFWRLILKENKNISFESPSRKLTIYKHIPVQIFEESQGKEITFVEKKPTFKPLWASDSEQKGGIDQIEFSTDSGFKNKIEPLFVKKISQSVSGRISYEAQFSDLDSKMYSWRIRTTYSDVGAKGTKKVSFVTPIQKMQVLHFDQFKTPVLKEPEDQSSLQFSSENPTVRFRWEGVEEASGYLIEVATDKKFEDVVYKKWVTGFDEHWEVEKNGNYFWRVRSTRSKKPSESDSLPSRIRSFFYTKKGGIQLISPEDQKVIVFKSEKPLIKFQWEPVHGAKFYQFQVAADSQFNQVIYRKVIQKNELETLKMPLGVRYWRVRALDKNKKPLLVSSYRSLDLHQPPLLAEVEKIEPESARTYLAEKVKSIQFKWKEVKGAKSYQWTLYQVDPSGAQKKIDQKIIEGLSVSLTPTPMTYEWNVRAIDEVGRLGNEGKPRSFTLKYGDRLAGPEIIEPVLNAKIQEENPYQIDLEWKEVEGAQGYLVKVYLGSPEKGKVFKKFKTKENSVSLSKNIPSGQYTWKVSAFGIAKGSKKQKPRWGEFSESSFLVRWIGVLRAPASLKVKVESDQSEGKK